MMSRTVALSFVAAAVAFTACTQSSPGPQGPQGPKGDPGAAGPAGSTVLFSSVVELPGANCVNGGVELRSGVDADRDGVLDDTEVDAAATRYLCDGAQGATGPMGAPGLSSVFKTTLELTGSTQCPTGGVRLDVGLDANGNGALDVGELDVAQSQLLCNGPQGPQGAQGPQGMQGAQGDQGPAGPAGPSTLARTTAEPAGANCATGGVKLELGTDANANGTLDVAEVNAALTRFVCNGAQGVQGATGPSGPQGPAGQLGIYGDGSAGALLVPVGNTLDLSTVAGVNALPFRQNLQFSSVTISGTLIVPSGTVIRCTGDVTISGTLFVLPGTGPATGGVAHPGISLAPATSFRGGTGLALLSAAHVVSTPVSAGGAGVQPSPSSGGEGGGAFSLFARGNVSIVVGGSINANGNNGGVVSGGADLGGNGGGAGGVVLVVGRNALSVAGAVRANGGAGGAGLNGNGGTNGAGGGGGGGGGIIHLLSTSSISVTGTVQANGGASGTDAAGTTNTAGGGGGACGGSGGRGGANDVFGNPFSPAGAGSAGYVLQTVVASPENLLF
ncbi:MAG: DUF7151 family protein [Myxococcota bacterium]